MAFKRAVSETFTAKVKVNIPNEKGGFDPSTFTATFRRMTTDQLNDLRGLADADVVRRTLVDWDLVDADTNEKVPFSAAEMEALLQIKPTDYATAKVFWDTVQGVGAKN